MFSFQTIMMFRSMFLGSPSNGKVGWECGVHGVEAFQWPAPETGWRNIAIATKIALTRWYIVQICSASLVIREGQ